MPHIWLYLNHIWTPWDFKNTCRFFLQFQGIQKLFVDPIWLNIFQAIVALQYLFQTENVQEIMDIHGPRCDPATYTDLHSTQSKSIQAAENVCMSRMLAGLRAYNQCNQISLSNANTAPDATIELQSTTILPGLKRTDCKCKYKHVQPRLGCVHKSLLRSQHVILWIRSFCLISYYFQISPKSVRSLGLGFPMGFQIFQGEFPVTMKSQWSHWGWHSLGGCAARSSESNCLVLALGSPEAQLLESLRLEFERQVIIVCMRERN